MTGLALMLLAAASAAQAAPARIGAAGGVSGGVSAAAPSEAKARTLKSGDDVFHKDAVSTDSRGRMQAMLLDETVFTVGPNSKVVLDEFVYDPFTDAGKVRAEVVKGVFRLVTGKSARRNPDVKVKTPSGTIGIRGTIAGGSVDGDRTLVALLGPGPDNNADEKPGAVTVTNDQGSVALDRPGTGTLLLPGEPPSPPFILSPADLAALDAGGSGTSAGASGESAAAGSSEESAADESGETTALGGDNAIQADAIADAAGNANGNALDAIRSRDDNSNGVSRWDEIRTLPSGEAHYFASTPWNLSSCGGNGCNNNSAGTIQFQMNINFADKNIGGFGSQVSVSDTDSVGPTTVNQFINIPLTDWGPDGTLAHLDISETAGNITNTTAIDIMNVNGAIAHQAKATFTHQDTGTGNYGSGSTTAPRFDGLIPQ